MSVVLHDSQANPYTLVLWVGRHHAIGHKPAWGYYLLEGEWVYDATGVCRRVWRELRLLSDKGDNGYIDALLKHASANPPTDLLDNRDNEYLATPKTADEVQK